MFDDASMDAILKDLAKRAVQVTFDSVEQIEFSGARFCLTGAFNQSHDDLKGAIESRGGTVAENVSRRLRYLVVGVSGSTEWKYGSFGTKVEKAMLIKEEDGAALSIISEDQLIAALAETPRCVGPKAA
jgi:NAD-dependent DNA ligase